MTSFKHILEVYHITTHEPTYPPLDRTAFLIERTCVPNYVPPYCAETGQLFAMLAKAVSQNTSLPKESDSD